MCVNYQTLPLRTMYVDKLWSIRDSIDKHSLLPSQGELLCSERNGTINST
jgi:hypothetical protein